MGRQYAASRSDFAKVALVAGFLGGIAEIVWVGIYCHLTGLSSGEIARQIPVSLSLPAQGPAAPLWGLIIHLALSLMLGAVYAATIWPPLAARCGVGRSMLTAAAVLAAIWAVNFFLVLPIINPVFVGLMPYPVTLISKILFGISMAWAFERARDRQSIHELNAWRASAVKMS